MTDTAERIGKLAAKWDREPNVGNHVAWHDYANRQNIRRDLLAIATPGAELGAAVDLFEFALAGKGWEFALYSPHSPTSGWCCQLETQDMRDRFATEAEQIEGRGPTAAAALLAAMEGI